MSSVNIRTVSSRKDKKRFLRFPWDHYADDPNWIPPLLHGQKALLGWLKHPFYKIAESQSFIALKNDQVVGRITAILNHAHNDLYNEKRGFVGFFESTNDQEVSNELFKAAQEWLSRREIHDIRGPANPSLNYESGLLVDGFDSPPVFMMTYNKTYYPELWEAFGFTKVKDLVAYNGIVNELYKREAKFAKITERALKLNDATIRPINTKRFYIEVKDFLELYNHSLEGLWGSVPLTDDELQFMAKDLRHMIIPEIALFAESNQTGKPIGAVLGLVDYNPIIKEINGRLLPFGFLKLFLKRKQMKKMRVLSINVSPEFQGMALGVALMKAMFHPVKEMGIEEAEFSWILEDNMNPRKTLEKAGSEVYKTYRMYDFSREGSAE